MNEVTQNPSGKAMKLLAVISYTQQNGICFEGVYEFPGRDVGMGMTSSFSRKRLLPQANTALLQSAWPAAGSCWFCPAGPAP